MNRRYNNKILEIVYPSRVEGWLDAYDVESDKKKVPNEKPWQPLYCVLQQDEQTFTAYCSEELSLADMLFADLPRIRLDKVNRTKVLQFWEAPPTLQEEPEDGTGENGDVTTMSENLQLNMTLQNMQVSIYWLKNLFRLRNFRILPYFFLSSHPNQCKLVIDYFIKPYSELKFNKRMDLMSICCDIMSNEVDLSFNLVYLNKEIIITVMKMECLFSQIEQKTSFQRITKKYHSNYVKHYLNYLNPITEFSGLSNNQICVETKQNTNSNRLVDDIIVECFIIIILNVNNTQKIIILPKFCLILNVKKKYESLIHIRLERSLLA
uniref:CSON013905 protein n=1 Tax=Culicoides sonorensis TaxID=179676 RepID=A0A336MDF1_CULSO